MIMRLLVLVLSLLLCSLVTLSQAETQTFDRQDRDYRPLQFGKRDGYRPLQFGKRDYRPLQFGKRSGASGASGLPEMIFVPAASL